MARIEMTNAWNIIVFTSINIETEEEKKYICKFLSHNLKSFFLFILDFGVNGLSLRLDVKKNISNDKYSNFFVFVPVTLATEYLIITLTMTLRNANGNEKQL